MVIHNWWMIMSLTRLSFHLLILSDNDLNSFFVRGELITMAGGSSLKSSNFSTSILAVLLLK